MPQSLKPSVPLRDLAAALDTRAQRIPYAGGQHPAPQAAEAVQQTASVARLAADLADEAAEALGRAGDGPAHHQAAAALTGAIEYVADALSTLGSATHQLIQLAAPLSRPEESADVARMIGELNFDYARHHLRDAADNLRAAAEEVDAVPTRDGVALRRSAPTTVKPPGAGPTNPPAPAAPARPARGRP